MAGGAVEAYEIDTKLAIRLRGADRMIAVWRLIQEPDLLPTVSGTARQLVGEHDRQHTKDPIRHPHASFRAKDAVLIVIKDVVQRRCRGGREGQGKSRRIGRASLRGTGGG